MAVNEVMRGDDGPSFKLGDDMIAPHYDSSAEPEANGRPYEQSYGIVDGAHLAEAKADRTANCTQGYFEKVGNHDLITAAPKIEEDSDPGYQS